MTFETEEIEHASLKDGEDEILETEYKRMSNSQKIVASIKEAYALTSGEDGSASEQLSRAIRALSDASGYEDRAMELYRQLVEVDSLLNDVNRELADYEKACEFSEEEFYEIENRLNEINHIKQKYGNTITQVQEYYEEQLKKIKVLNDYDTYISTLEKELIQAQKDYKKYAGRLSQIRKEQAQILAQEIQSGLQELNFADVAFEILFGETSGYTEIGTDDVEFMISLNPGQPVKPLVNVASGGELSRIMLAIKTVMADRDDIETLIFDEIDVGISGRTAQKVSEKMAVIGRGHQVICITHLAQIAAMADAHYAIEKTVTKDSTTTDIRLLNEKESVQELARILGGAKITETVLQNAIEMKELAKHTK